MATAQQGVWPRSLAQGSWVTQVKAGQRSSEAFTL